MVRSRQSMRFPRGMKDIDVSILYTCNQYFPGATILACSKWDTIGYFHQYFHQIHSCQDRSALHFLLLGVSWWLPLLQCRILLDGKKKWENAQNSPVLFFPSRGWGKLLKSSNYFCMNFWGVWKFSYWILSIGCIVMYYCLYRKKCESWSLVYQTSMISVSGQLHMLNFLI